MPSVSSLEALHRAVAGFEAADLNLVIEPPALAAAQRSLDESGLLLLGEVHGVRENPLVIRALLQAFGLTSLALEWPDDLAPVIGAFLAGGTLTDHPTLWFGDGRITAGHLAVLLERSAGGPLDLTLFDGIIGVGWDWSQRDEAMAGRILAAAPAANGTLVAAGNAHTPTSPTTLGVPLGACLARRRPGVQEIRLQYGGGHYYNLQPGRFRRRTGLRGGHPLLHQQDGVLVLDVPTATEATVPQQPQPWLRPGRTNRI
jgi:hypothetical protein